jgi:hypothetical protein
LPSTEIAPNKLLKEAIMKKNYLLLFLLFLSISLSAQKFNDEEFFKSLASDDLKLVDQQLALVKKSSMKEKDAYEGALLMKKAGLIPKPKAKLSSFKAGHKKLEQAIGVDSKNAKYRFLRLIIQENAPGILGYKDEIEEDSKYVRESFNALSPDVQAAVVNYSKTSKKLQLASTGTR